MAAFSGGGGNVLQRNRTVFVALFTVLLAVSLGAGVVLAVSGRRQVAPASADIIVQPRDESPPS